MADYIFQVRLQGTSGLSEDVFENVLCYSVNAPDTVQGTCNEIRDLYIGTGTGQTPFLTGYQSVEVRAYELAGGQPIASAGPTTAPSRTATPMPYEVAICLSYAAVDDPNKSLARRRGRIFLGPLLQTQAAVRPAQTIRDQVLAFGQSLAAVGLAGNTTWKLFSRTDNVTAKIESIWVDDAWDTQRRRGLKPTLKQVQDVQ